MEIKVVFVGAAGSQAAFSTRCTSLRNKLALTNATSFSSGSTDTAELPMLKNFIS